MSLPFRFHALPLILLASRVRLAGQAAADHLTR